VTPTEQDIAQLRDQIIASDHHLGMALIGVMMHPEFAATLMHAFRAWTAPASGPGFAALQFDARRLQDALTAVMSMVDIHVTETARANVHFRYVQTLLNTPAEGPPQGH
jgi:hypothetical protein